MSKRLLWILAAFMAVTMTGLILVQSYWISNALEIKEKQFSQLVSRSMSNIISQMEAREAALMVYEFMEPLLGIDTAFNNQSLDFRLDTGQRVISNTDSGYFSFEQQITMGMDPAGNPSGSLKIRVNDDSLLIVNPDSGTVDSIIAGAFPGVANIPDPAEIRRRLLNKQKQLDRAMSRMLIPHARIEDRLSYDITRKFIDNELLGRGIDLNYEFAVIRSSGQIAFKSSNYAPDRNAKLYTSRLFPQDVFSKPNYLLMYFPFQKTFLYKSVGLMGISSVILTLIIISVFILTLWIIFRQKKLSEMKNDFVNNMTHELKTPISTISLASQMLSDNSIPSENKNIEHISSIINTESKRLGFQVEKVLQMAVFDRGKLKLKEKLIDMNEVIWSTVNNFNIQVEKRGGTLEYLPEASHVKIIGDNVHLTNVLSNLLDNAMKYCQDIPKIIVRTFNEKHFLVIRVEDKGIGISKEEQNRIFEKFYRVSTGNLHNVKGFGLGLSYVKKIVDIHGGNIKLKSELNKGTRFDIYLPVNDEK